MQHVILLYSLFMILQIFSNFVTILENLLQTLDKFSLLRYNNIANLIKVLVRGNPPGLVQWKPMNLVRSERKQQ